VQPALGGSARRERRHASDAPDPMDALSEREREVLELLVLGHTNVEIASLMFLSPRTIETHRANVQRKLGVKSRADHVRFASRPQRGAMTERPDL
jgi:DNA-binding NarL/FixJ family response regulator